MEYISSVDFDQGRGQWEGVVIKTYGIEEMTDYACMDRDKRYFISTASSLSDGSPYSRMGWRQQEWDDEHFGQVNNEEAVREELFVAQPKCLDIYYDTYAAIDQHSLQRQDTLCIP